MSYYPTIRGRGPDPASPHDPLDDERFVLCEPCEGSGRHMVYHNPRQGEVAPCNERDVGECPHCYGSGVVEVKTQPVEMDDNSDADRA